MRESCWLESSPATVKISKGTRSWDRWANYWIARCRRLTKDRGKVIQHDLAPAVIATLHPSAILRAPDEAAREKGSELLVTDLKLAAKRAKRTR